MDLCTEINICRLRSAAGFFCCRRNSSILQQNRTKKGDKKMQKYIQLEGFIKSNNEAVEAVVQHLAEKYKMEKETIKKYVDGVTVNPEETYDFLDKIYTMTKTTKQKQRLVYVHVAEYYIEKLAERTNIVTISPKETA